LNKSDGDTGASWTAQRHADGGGEPRALATPTEVADYLRVPIRTLYRWRYAGEGPPGYRVGRHLRFRWADVEEWLGRSGPAQGSHRVGRPRNDTTRRDNAPLQAGRPKAS
jgi:excisionase family DNA binding protein